LTYLKKNPKALSSALMRIKDYNTLNGNYLALFRIRKHPPVWDERIAKMVR